MAFYVGDCRTYILVLILILVIIFSSASESPPSSSSSSWLSECHQTDLGLNCSALALEELQGIIPEFVTAMDLSENLMKNEDTLPYGENLRSLSLRKNKLNGDLIWNWDARLPSLEDLDLSDNELSTYPSHLPITLRKIDLARNSIRSVSEIVLDGHLEELFLMENKISGLVDLCYREHSDSPNKCSAAEKLIKFDLSKNAITGLVNKGFEALKGLQVLTLASNLIKSLSKSTFTGLENLRMLDLSDNKLREAHGEAFGKLTELKYLYLRNNRLLTIPCKLPLLDWFDISYNNIRRVNESLNTSLYPIEMVIMGHNPFHCDCHMLWLKEWYDRREYILDYSVDIPPDEYIPSCASPDHVAGDHWDVLADQVFLCAPEEPKSENPLEELPRTHEHQHKHPGQYADSDTEKYIAIYDLHVQVRSVHPTLVKLEWRAPTHYTNLLIQYFKTEEEEDTTLFAQIQATQGHHVLKNLDPESTYRICVLPKADALAPLSDINDCLSINTPKGPGNNVESTSFLWFQVDHTLESRFRMIFACLAVSIVLVASGLLITEVFSRLNSHNQKEHDD